MKRISMCVSAVAVCAAAAVGVAQDDAVLIMNDDALKLIETRTPIDPPGPGDFLPAAASIVVNTPGSYVLTGNVIGVAGKHGIEITKSNVTIDLNGYALIGVTGSKNGVWASKGVVNVKIHNGAIRGWGERGIAGKQMTASEVSDVRVGNCGLNGIHLGQGIVKNCTSRQNGNDGIHVQYGRSVIASCAVELNGGDGVECGKQSTISDVSSNGNKADGIFTSAQCIINRCAASENGGDGIQGAGGTVVTECTTFYNGLNGILVTNDSQVNLCTAIYNAKNGIIAHAGTVVSSCSVIQNAIYGILANQQVVVRDCLVRSSGSTGIRCDHRSTITGNTCLSNGGRIIVTGSFSTIDSNTLNANTPYGIRVEDNANIITRNSLGFADYFDIVGGNDVGTIQTTPVDAGPWDNFDY